MVVISSQTFDLRGYVIFNNTAESDIFQKARRVSRQKTLDGGVVLSDFGFSHGDRTLRIVTKATVKQADNLSYLFENYPMLTISIIDGLFTGSIRDIKYTSGKLVFTFLIKAKLTEI